MYREAIKVLDCTIRDGGLINNHYFTDEFVRAVYIALSQAGIDYMEMGYRSSRQYAPPSDYGDWKYCDDEKIRRIIDGVESKVKLSIMVDAHRVLEQEFAPVDQSPIDMIRIATYVKDIDKAITAKRCHDLEYRRRSISWPSARRTSSTLSSNEALAETPTRRCTSSTATATSSASRWVYRQAVPEVSAGQASASIATTTNSWPSQYHRGHSSRLHLSGRLAVRHRRGAENCPLELIIGFLKNPKFNIEPILKVIQDYMIP